MNHIEIKPPVTYTVYAHTLQVGEAAVVLEGEAKDHVILRTHDRLISLTNPTLSWNGYCDLTIRKLEPGTVVSITLPQNQKEMDAEVLRLLQAGQKINAIKAVRAATFRGLKEAKEYVERLEAAQRASEITQVPFGGLGSRPAQDW